MNPILQLDPLRFFEDRYGNRLLSIRDHRIKSHAPQGFCSERRHFSLWLGNQGLARRRTWVPPRGASRSCLCRRRRQWPSRLAVPPPQGGKGPFPDGNLLFRNPSQPLAHGAIGAECGDFRLHYSSAVAMLCFSVSRRNDSIGEDLIFEICSTIFIADREQFEGGRT